MTSFTKSFIWRFILDIILLGFLVRILQSIVLGIMSRLIESTSAIFLISEAIIVSSLSMLSIQDAYPKMLIARTRHDAYQYEGIRIVDFSDWLTSK